VARAASTTARAGEVAMDSSVSSILGLRGTIAETSKKVKRLGESSQQISKAVVLINQLATKTKLLAINASIEAALAGESGQGFAVVAEEVGQLAAQSASATQDIAKIVDLIQQEVGDVVQAMEEGTLQVVEGTKLVEETRRSLGQVLDVSRQIDVLVASISTATVAQAETSETVTHLMQQIASVSEHTAGTSQQVSDALHETVTVAEQLQASVGTFKI
jgi:methyl-accepting chemotaxis protein PixJ